jgi:cell division protein ZapE
MSPPPDLRGRDVGADSDHGATRELQPTPRQRYDHDLQQPGFIADSAQAQAVDALQQVYEQLIQNPPKRRFGSSRLSYPPVQGLYMWGGVGRGKTYLMDAFYEALPFSRKRRTHFHRFMLEVHERRGRHPDQQDPLLKVADEIADSTRVLCFDEFYVSDIADAMILGRLFEFLFKRGLSLVATSNVDPDLLYKDGLQRENFLPAIERLKQHCAVLNVDGGNDYRLRALHGMPLYLHPCDKAAMAALGERFYAVAPHGLCERIELKINERVIAARCVAEGAVWFDFHELCDGPRGPADYIEVARTYHTVVLSYVPLLTSDDDNSARRFINLVDEFYDRGVNLLIGAEAPMEQLYLGTKLKFEFQRTVSRLIEMQSQEYLAKPHLT